MNEIELQICPLYPFCFKEDGLTGLCCQWSGLCCSLPKFNKRLVEDSCMSTECNFKQDSIINPKSEFTEVLQYNTQGIRAVAQSLLQLTKIFQ